MTITTAPRTLGPASATTTALAWSENNACADPSLSTSGETLTIGRIDERHANTLRRQRATSTIPSTHRAPTTTQRRTCAMVRAFVGVRSLGATGAVLLTAASRERREAAPIHAVHGCLDN